MWYHGYARAMRVASKVQKRARQRALPRLAAALVEFQKAQCYFMIAVQIAGVVTVPRGRLDPINLQQLYNNSQAVRVISMSGVLPTTFTLLCLQYAGKSSWYLDLLSTITVCISAASFFVTEKFSPGLNDMKTLRKKTQKNDLLDCGNYDPSVYCLTRHFDNTDSYGTIIFFYSLIILILLYVPLLKTRLSRFYQRCKTRLRHIKVLGIVVPRLDGVRSIFGRVFNITLRKLFGAGALNIRNDWQAIVLSFFYLAAWILYLLCFRAFMEDLYLFIDNGLVDFKWTFGQIVGITVWAEPLVEYAYLEISESAPVVKSTILRLCRQLLTRLVLNNLEGMKAANYRFLSPWAVVEDGSSNDDEPSPGPEQHVISAMDRDQSGCSGFKSGFSLSADGAPGGFSFDEPERCTIRSYSSLERDESLEAGEGQLHADNMAQHLV